MVAWLGALGRSMPHSVAPVHELADRRVGFRNPAESMNTTSTSSGSCGFDGGKDFDDRVTMNKKWVIHELKKPPDFGRLS